LASRARVGDIVGSDDSTVETGRANATGILDITFIHNSCFCRPLAHNSIPLLILLAKFGRCASALAAHDGESLLALEVIGGSSNDTEH